MQDKHKKVIAMLEQRKQVIQKREELRSVILPIIESFEGKQINKRMETAIQAELDRVYGKEPLTEEQARWRDDIDGWSRVFCRYSKDSTWSGEPRHRLEVSSKQLVKRLPDVDMGDYKTPDPDNDNEVTAGASFAENYLQLREAFTPDPQAENKLAELDRAIADIEKIQASFDAAVEAVKAYYETIANYGEAHYIIDKKINNKKISRIY